MIKDILQNSITLRFNTTWCRITTHIHTHTLAHIQSYMKEDKEQKPISFKGAVGLVAGLHILAGIGIFYASIPKSFADDKKFINTTEANYTGVPDEQVKPIPTPTPEPLKQEITDEGKIATYPRPISTPTPIAKIVNSKYTQSYTIKKGDTIHSISKRYGLNTKKLLEINHIKNPNNIRVGQVLKFL
jgi:LysM repeat protein